MLEFVICEKGACLFAGAVTRVAHVRSCARAHVWDKSKLWSAMGLPSGGGGEQSRIKRPGCWLQSLKRPPMRYQDPALKAWLEIVFTHKW